MTSRAMTSSTTMIVSRKPRSRSGKWGPTRASMPSANAVSVDIATPHPWAELSPALKARKIAIGTIIPPRVGQHRQRQAAALAELADVELAPHLEPDDEEEERHQAVVDPVAEVLGDARGADLDREVGVPEAFVGVEVDVGPGERRDRRRQQDDGAADLGREEVAQRALQAARPGGPAAEPRLGARVAHPGSFSSPVTLVGMRRMLQLVLLSVALAICGGRPRAGGADADDHHVPGERPAIGPIGAALDHGRAATARCGLPNSA